MLLLLLFYKDEDICLTLVLFCMNIWAVLEIETTMAFTQ